MKIRAEQVLEALASRGRGRGLTVKELLAALRKGGRDQRLVRRVLRELERSGQVERVGRRFRLARRDGLIEGIFSRGPGRGGWVTDAAGEVWEVAESAGAEPGDRALLLPLRAAGAEPARGEILEVLDALRREWVGIASRDLHGAVVTPYRDDREWGIRVAARDLAGARDGDVVVVAPARGKTRAGAPTGRVVEVLGPPGAPEADFRAVVWRRRLPVEFPEQVIAEAEGLPEQPSREECARRRDLRGLPFATIDPATARDHDDAVCVEPLSGGGARLHVAIADVSHFVAEGGALDREALRRGNSVYFPDRAIPMLPERLSGDVCSLRDGVDRLVMAAALDLDAQGKVRASRFEPALIRSRARLAYERAAEEMQRPGAAKLRDPELEASLAGLAHVAETLFRRRAEAGSIDFDLPAPEIVLGPDGMPIDVVASARTVAHRAIEEAMLAANRAVAEALAAASVPTLYRVHEPPTPGDMETLRSMLEAFHLIPGGGGRGRPPLEPRAIARALLRAVDHPEERLVHMVALRSMQQARYAADNRGHFALAFDSYLHFTSPIRRYADLVVHRALKDHLAGGGALARARRRGEDLEAVATRVSWRERVAMEAEREMLDLKKCAFMASRVGSEFDGTVTGVARHGFYVTLDDAFVEGLVHVSTLDDYVRLDERTYALVGRTGARYRLGDRFRVHLDAVDMARTWINFSVVRRLEERA